MLAYALRHSGRAVLVGDRTAGQVLTARNWPLPDGGRLSVATGNFTTANGARLEAVGVSPDIAVSETLNAIREGRDLVIEAADAALAGKLAAQAAALNANVSAP
jgi:carboxyl-terminal processing protease